MAGPDVAIPIDGLGNAKSELRHRKRTDIENPGSQVVVRGTGGPPVDDCCPICFGGFTIPCKTNCGHWFCANCILMFWNYSNAFQRCKCPICTSYIRKFVPEASLNLQQDEEVVETLKKVQKYNQLFSGGARSLILRMHQFPLFINRITEALIDPERYLFNYLAIRLFSSFMTVLQLCEFDFIPSGLLEIIELSTLGIFVILSLIGLYRSPPRRLHPGIRRFLAQYLPWFFKP